MSDYTDHLAPSWGALRLFSTYRIGVVCALALVFFFAGTPLGQVNPGLFQLLLGAYFIGAVCAFLAARWQLVGFFQQVVVGVVSDLIFLAAISQTSYELSLIMGILMNVAIAGGSILAIGQISFFFAAIATLSILAERLLATSISGYESVNWVHAGLISTTFFATATVAFLMSMRIRKSEALASQRGEDISKLEHLNDHIVQLLKSGVIVVDRSKGIHLMNRSAWYMLGMPKREPTQILTDLSATLGGQYELWRKNGQQPREAISVNPRSSQLSVHFTPLGSHARAGVLITLEDTAKVHQQAQQIKLASLGRLAASIAHEIRNPLGAMSHAVQLLDESPKLQAEERRFTEIIQKNAERMNVIVENVLQLSRRQKTQVEQIDLANWLPEFIASFKSEGNEAATIQINVSPEACPVDIDPNQIHQVLSNLCRNGLRYSEQAKGSPEVSIQVIKDQAATWLEVIDSGFGIDEDSINHIFEPFFTTENEGTGLGLYLCKELCEANQVQIEANNMESGGACFRLIFPNRSEAS